MYRWSLAAGTSSDDFDEEATGDDAEVYKSALLVVAASSRLTRDLDIFFKQREAPQIERLPFDSSRHFDDVPPCFSSASLFNAARAAAAIVSAVLIDAIGPVSTRGFLTFEVSSTFAACKVAFAPILDLTKYWSGEDN